MKNKKKRDWRRIKDANRHYEFMYQDGEIVVNGGTLSYLWSSCQHKSFNCLADRESKLESAIQVGFNKLRCPECSAMVYLTVNRTRNGKYIYHAQKPQNYDYSDFRQAIAANTPQTVNVNVGEEIESLLHKKHESAVNVAFMQGVRDDIANILNNDLKRQWAACKGVITKNLKKIHA